MSDSASWYARKFGGQRQQPQAQRPPPGYIPQPQQQFVQFQPQGQPIQQQAPKVTIDTLWGAMQQWRGGKAHKIDPDPCPECGSNRYYSRTEGARRGPPPAPHCFDCGFNGLFEQGMASSWQPG